LGSRQAQKLTEVFAIEICAYAVIQNHTHTVVMIDQQRELAWSHEEVINRWTTFYKPSPIVDIIMALN
jgi:hypothetical protein